MKRIQELTKFLVSPLWAFGSGKDLLGSMALGWIPLAIAAGSAIMGAIQGNKAQKAAAEAAKASQVDINALDAKTREIARQNALESAELERQLTPEVPQLRQQSLQGVMRGLADSEATNASRDALMGRLGQDVAGPAMSPLLAAAVAKAKADLDLGGGLDVETKNQIMRSGIARAGGVAGPGSVPGLGRDITARDLGLTSLQLQNQRLANAAQLGGQEQSAEEFNVGTRFNNAANLLNQIQLLRSIEEGGFGRNLAAAQFGQAIAQPVVGLDPGSIADVMTGNATNQGAALANKANIYGAQSQGLMNFAGNMAGYGLLGYGAKPAATTNTNTLPKTGYGLMQQPQFLSGAKPFTFVPTG